MAAPGLVAALDELEHRHAGLNLSAEAAAVEQLAFEGGEEAHLCASFSGWTWGCVETELTLPQVHALSEYLAEHPPVHLLVAAALGAKPTSAIKESTIEEVEAVASALGIPVTRHKKST